LAVFFTDFEIIGTRNAEQGSVKGELRRRTTVTERRPESPKLDVRRERQNPGPFETERAGHPEGLNPSLGINVLEWYHPTVMHRQEEKTRKGVPPAKVARAKAWK
jgi:hypothetical protein